MELEAEFHSIQQKFNNTRKPWAVTGSYAMKLYAQKFGLQVRKTNDYDFVIRPTDLYIFTSELEKLGYSFRGPPPAQSGFRRLQLKKGNVEVDLLAEKSILAGSLEKNVEVHGKTPIMKIQSLLNSKRRIMNNNNNFGKNGNNKTLGNMKTLTQLLSMRG
jgi:hypothetical protein